MAMLAAETDFGLEMLRQAPVTQSCVVSPISVMLALTMVQAGSRGRTKTEINCALAKGVRDSVIFDHFANLSAELGRRSEGVHSNIANGLFLDKRFELNGNYERLIERNFAAKVATINYDDAQGSAKLINNFVYSNTGGKIDNLIRPASLADAAATIVNAIYFQGEWKHKFSKKRTAKATFFSTQNTFAKKDFMRTKARRAYAEDDKVQVLSLKYKNPAYALNILLPKKRFGLDEILKECDGERIQKLMSQLRATHLSIAVPKMKLESSFDLKQALISMCITDLFSENADLSGITNSGSTLSVSNAAHKAVLEMDEESTTAAGATDMNFGYKMAVNTIDFNANHPFLFVLTKSGVRGRIHQRASTVRHVYVFTDLSFYALPLQGKLLFMKDRNAGRLDIGERDAEWRHFRKLARDMSDDCPNSGTSKRNVLIVLTSRKNAMDLVDPFLRTWTFNHSEYFKLGGALNEKYFSVSMNSKEDS